MRSQYLNKILCGLAPEAQLPAVMPMNIIERFVSGWELQALLYNWSAIRDSPVDALRGYFILRDASLYKDTAHWYLQVESEAYDVQLKDFPFNMTLIRLPRMQADLTVDWK